MSLVFDTSILIAIERGDRKTINELKKLSRVHPLPAQIAFICYYEFLRGIKITKPKKYKELLEFIRNFNVLQTTNTTAEILCDLRIKYDSAGEMLSLADLLIASQTIENHLTLVTKDRHFKRIGELKVVCWSEFNKSPPPSSSLQTPT